MNSRAAAWTRAVPAVLVLAMPLGGFAAGCGSDDRDVARDVDTGSVPDTRHDGRPKADEAQIRWLVGAMEDYFVAGDAAAYCSNMTRRGRRLLIGFSRSVGLGDTCAEFVENGAERNRETGTVQKPTRVLSVEVDGDRAVAIVRDGGRPPQPLPFVKRGGAWKVPDPGVRDVFGRGGSPPPSGLSP